MDEQALRRLGFALLRLCPDVEHECSLLLSTGHGDDELSGLSIAEAVENLGLLADPELEAENEELKNDIVDLEERVQDLECTLRAAQMSLNEALNSKHTSVERARELLQDALDELDSEIL
jgi:hypothetical protein